MVQVYKVFWSPKSREVLPNFQYSRIIFFLPRTRACLICFMCPALSFSDFILSAYFPFVSLSFWSSLAFMKLSTTKFSNKFSPVEYSLSIFYACPSLLLFPRSAVKNKVLGTNLCFFLQKSFTAQSESSIHT